jgi:hypothetical protein
MACFGFGDVRRPAFNIDVGPSQLQYLTAPQARVYCERDDR